MKKIEGIPNILELKGGKRGFLMATANTKKETTEKERFIKQWFPDRKYTIFPMTTTAKESVYAIYEVR